MATVKLYLRPSAQRGRNPDKLYMRVTHDGLSRTIVMHYRIWPEEWDDERQSLVLPQDNTRRKRQLLDYKDGLSRAIRQMNSVLKELERQQGRYTVDEVMSRYRVARAELQKLSIYAEYLAVDMRGQGSNRTARAYGTAVSRLQDFNMGKELSLEQLTAELMGSFQQALISEGISMSTLSFYMRMLRAIYNKAIDEGLIPWRLNTPFDEVYTEVLPVVKPRKSDAAPLPVDTLPADTLSDTPAPAPTAAASGWQPTIVRDMRSWWDGRIYFHSPSYCIGYIVHGHKTIYYGDRHCVLKNGDLFWLGVGAHQVEDVPETGCPFEQITFCYNQSRMRHILIRLKATRRLEIGDSHTCEICRQLNHADCHGWSEVHDFFSEVSHNLRNGAFENAPESENKVLTELVYLLLNHNDSCMRGKIVESADLPQESIRLLGEARVASGRDSEHASDFEKFVNKHIFSNLPLEELARMSDCSLSAFFEQFKRYFSDTPHRWFLKQRLIHAAQLLGATYKPVSKISTECGFPNTSHFINRFKKEYGMTPWKYRNEHNKPAIAGD